MGEVGGEPGPLHNKPDDTLVRIFGISIQFTWGLDYAYEKNIPIVAVTGNSWLPEGGQRLVQNPGSSDIVIAVGATNINKEKADYSNYGPTPPWLGAIVLKFPVHLTSLLNWILPGFLFVFLPLET